MNIYVRKQRWKWVLMIVAMLIVGVSLWYTNVLVRKIADEERKKVTFWADAIQQKAELVKYTGQLFEKLKNEERKRVELWAKAIKKLVDADSFEDLTFYSEIISSNTTIPVVLVNSKQQIIASLNVDFNADSLKIFNDSLSRVFADYEPIEVKYGNKKDLLYYKDSKLFTGLRKMLDDIIKSFISEVVVNSASVPVIITDSIQKNIISHGNLDSTKVNNENYLKDVLESMKKQNKPIEIYLTNFGKSFIFYNDSHLLTQLRYFPYVQLSVIGIFLLVAYFLFSTARNAEQNQVWVGMSKETAHQLGTPLSSMLAWIELLKEKYFNDSSIDELSNDVKRLETITSRFSNIGSQPKLENENLSQIIFHAIDYMKKRTSKSVVYTLNFNINENLQIPINKNLFEWVIENLCKNAADAMGGIGHITLDVTEDNKFVFIDVSDTGKGIPKSKQKTIFNPGYTSKQRGWGLGLSLAERIIENYHSGKLFVKQSVINKGTTFRIVLNKT